ncbi:hypothetical protein A6M23_17325 [Acidithiobacillus thiooxidans]|uniref:Uncharacterized protein n=2 Tax=Acidithiobacillus thiooxidans TaxID=930 RepID=A0A1C2J2K5_ACITH|nr:hypothetical protein A6M23_17325 [Acidithiobacillus thiooxidans]OCX82476.1 hypothetical protein A6P08_11700 [Acidithiobacillus thiooxidans]
MYQHADDKRQVFLLNQESIMSIKDLLRRDPRLSVLRDSLGGEHTPVFYSSLADNVSAVHDPITGAVFLSPALVQQPQEWRQALLARELGRATAPKRSRRWRLGVTAFLLCVILDVVLMQVPLAMMPRLLDAGVATLCFWLAIWQFRGLYARNTIQQTEQHASAWARDRVENYDELIAQATARQSIARYLRPAR